MLTFSQIVTNLKLFAYWSAERSLINKVCLYLTLFWQLKATINRPSKLNLYYHELWWLILKHNHVFLILYYQYFLKALKSLWWSAVCGFKAAKIEIPLVVLNGRIGMSVWFLQKKKEKALFINNLYNLLFDN